MFQNQGLERWGAFGRLAHSGYDLLVIPSGNSLKGGERIDMKARVAELRAARPGRLVLAYIDLGAAETDQAYWTSSWKAPVGGKPGIPDFLAGGRDPRWNDTYPVVFWDPRWQALTITGETSVLSRAMAAGFDGVWLDWVEAYEDPSVAAAARRQGVDPAREMTRLLAAARSSCLAKNPAAVIVAQDAPLFDPSNADALACVDGIFSEGAWFTGRGDVEWDDASNGDQPNLAQGSQSTAERLARYGRLTRAGVPVLTIDYCLNPANAARVYAESARHHLIPLVTRSSVARITTTPPPGVEAK